MSEYEALIIALARARENVSDLIRKYGPFLAELKAAENYAKTLEQNVRDLAMRDFLETGEKRFHPALDVKLVSVKRYDTKHNFQHALMSAPDAFVVDLEQLRLHAEDVVPVLSKLAPSVLKLDEKRIKAISEAPGGSWVEVDERNEPRVYLATKLGAFLIESEFGASHDGASNSQEVIEPDQERD